MSPNGSIFTRSAQLLLGNQHGHMVLFYEQDEFLLDTLSRFVYAFLSSCKPAITIVTREHRDDLTDRLYRYGLDVSEFIETGAYIEVDADQALSQSLVHGQPDSGRLERLVDDLFARTKGTSRCVQPVPIFSEMPALLWKAGDAEAAIRLEQLWDSSAHTRPLSLFCAYSMASFPRTEDGDPFQRICAAHTAVVPAESYSLLATNDERHRSVALLHQRSEALETEIRLRQAGQRFRRLIDAVPHCAIYVLDKEGRITTWSAGAGRILGYDESEILGQHFSCFFTEAEAASGKPSSELHAVGSRGRFETHGWRLRKGGWKFFATEIRTLLRDDAGAGIGRAVIMRDITEQMLGRNPLSADLDSIPESDASLGESSGVASRGQNEEWSDAHGEVASAEELAQCASLVAEPVEDVRTTSFGPIPPLLDGAGLNSAIPSYLDGFTKRTGIRTTFQTSFGFHRPSEEVNVALLGVLQDALAGIGRHSGSTTAEVQLLTESDRVVLTVSGAGEGTPEEFPTPSDEGDSCELIGLGEMIERVGPLSGRIEVSSSVHSTTITATIPVVKCAAAAASA